MSDQTAKHDSAAMARVKGQAGRRAHRADVHELLGADIVGVHQERLLVLLQITAQLGVILHPTPTRRSDSGRDMTTSPGKARPLPETGKSGNLCVQLYILKVLESNRLTACFFWILLIVLTPCQTPAKCWQSAPRTAPHQLDDWRANFKLYKRAIMSSGPCILSRMGLSAQRPIPMSFMLPIGDGGNSGK